MRLRLHSSVDGSSLELAQDESKCPTQFFDLKFGCIDMKNAMIGTESVKTKNELCSYL